MPDFGLIGYPLTHSWSALYFNRKFEELHLNDHEYKLFPIPSLLEFRDVLSRNPGLAGLNITIPFKIEILTFIDELSKEATAIGAVNCIKVSRNLGGIYLRGYNTDVHGFSQSLIPMLHKHHTTALVLGNGGSAKSVIYALDQLEISSTIVTRHPTESYHLDYNHLNKTILEEHSLIINTTPLGMFPDSTAFPPIPYEFISADHLLFDLIYNPEETTFLRRGREAGATVKNGMEMLQIQAERSWEIWNEG